MSCKNKLGNFPGIPDIDSALKSLSPKNIKGSVSTLAGRISNQVKNAVNDATGKLSDAGDLIGDLSSDMKKGITGDVKGIGHATISAIKSVKTEIANQYKGIKSLLECEESTTAESAKDVSNGNIAQAAGTKTTKQELDSLSNKKVKTLSESPQLQEEEAAKIATKSVDNSAAAATTQAKSTTVSTHQITVTKLEVTSQKQKLSLEDTAEYSLYLQQASTVSAAVKATQPTNKVSWDGPNSKEIEIKAVAREFNTSVTSKMTRILSMYTSGELTIDESKLNILFYVEAGKIFLAKIDFINNKIDSKQRNTTLSQSQIKRTDIEKEASKTNKRLI